MEKQTCRIWGNPWGHNTTYLLLMMIMCSIKYYVTVRTCRIYSKNNNYFKQMYLLVPCPKTTNQSVIIAINWGLYVSKHGRCVYHTSRVFKMSVHYSSKTMIHCDNNCIWLQSYAHKNDPTYTCKTNSPQINTQLIYTYYNPEINIQ